MCGRGHTMDVGSASGVVAGESRVELQDSVLIAELDATEHGVVDVACIGNVAVTGCNNATVYTSGVTVPCLESNLRDWLASVGIDELDIESQRHTWMAIGDVLADVLARDPCVAVSRVFPWL